MRQGVCWSQPAHEKSIRTPPLPRAKRHKNIVLMQWATLFLSRSQRAVCGIDGSQLFSPRIRYLNLRPQDRIHSLSRVWVCGRIVLSSHACIYARADVKCHQQNASCVHTLRQKAMHTRQREGERWMRCESACALKPNWERRGLGMSILGKKFNLNLLAIC